MPRRFAVLLLLALAAPARAAVLTPLPCALDIDCGDADACSIDVCDHGLCRHEAVPDCFACSSDIDCFDGDPCTSDLCTDAACSNPLDAACTPCTTAADCEDDDPCTAALCEETGVCTRPRTPGCGIPDPVEQCGNCVDDDGDGLADYDDADCCGTSGALSLDRLVVRHGTLRLTTRQPLPPAPADTTVQITDADGTRCLGVGAGAWTAARNGVLTAGSRRGKSARQLRLDPDTGTFRLAARDLGLVAGAVRVTLRVGTQCAHGGAVLRTRRGLRLAP